MKYLKIQSPEKLSQFKVQIHKLKRVLFKEKKIKVEGDGGCITKASPDRCDTKY